MHAIKPGHTYWLPNFEDCHRGQELQFIEKETDSQTQKTRTVKDGCTNETLLEVLIDRLNVLNAKFPCRENSIVITKLEESLMWLNKRTQERKARGVEGTLVK